MHIVHMSMLLFQEHADHDDHHHPVAGHHIRGELSFPAGLTARGLADHAAQNNVHDHHGDGVGGETVKSYLTKHHGEHNQAYRALQAAEIDMYDQWKRREHKKPRSTHKPPHRHGSADEL